MKINPNAPIRKPVYGKDATERGTNTTGGGAPKPMGPRPIVGKMAPEQTPRKPVYGKDATERGSNTKGGGAPKPMGPRPSVGKPAPDQMPRNPKPTPGKDSTERMPKPSPSVYRAKKGDGLWQVAEKTVPAGVTTAAWWAKIKKLNSTNGKVNRTYTNTGVKLPKK